MRVSVLASGSSGNSTFIETKESSFLIDAGISARRIAGALSSLGKDIREIDAVFVTHEHTDHTKGLERLGKIGLPIFMNHATYEASGLHLDKINLFSDGSDIVLNDACILPASVSHDAADTCCYSIRAGKECSAVITDLGVACPQVKKMVSMADNLVLETNHDVDMLISGPYPYPLKQRILGDRGHLSNIDAGLLVRDHGSDRLKNVFLAHLSRNNNTPELAEKSFRKIAGMNKDLSVKNIFLTDQDNNTELI